MIDPRDDIIQGQDKLMQRYEEALEQINKITKGSELVRSKEIYRWAVYGLTGGKKP